MHATRAKESHYPLAVSSTGRSRIAIHPVGLLRRSTIDGLLPEHLSVLSIHAVKIALPPIIGGPGKEQVVSPVDRRGLTFSFQRNLPEDRIGRPFQGHILGGGVPPPARASELGPVFLSINLRRETGQGTEKKNPGNLK